MVLLLVNYYMKYTKKHFRPIFAQFDPQSTKLQIYRKPTLTTVAGEASEKPTKVEVPFYYDYNIDALVYNYDDHDYYDPGLAVINHREGNGFLPTPVPTGAKGAVQPLGKLNNTGKGKSVGNRENEVKKS